MININSFQSIKRKGLFLALFILFVGFLSIHIYPTWVRTLPEISSDTLRACTYADGVFVAVGDGGCVWTSPDGRLDHWTKRNSGTTTNLYNITHGNGLFVAVGKGGAIYTSPTGSTWTQRVPNGGSAVSSLTCVAYNGTDLFVAGAYDANTYTQTSPDGITWTKNSTNINGTKTMCWGNGKFIVAGTSGGIYSSTNGVNWTSVSSGVSGVLAFTSSVYANGTYVLGGKEGACYTSTSGTSWTKRYTDDSGHYLMGMAWTGDDFFTAGNADSATPCSMVLVSPTGSSWVRDRTPTHRTLLGCASDGTTAIAVGAVRTILWNNAADIGDGLKCAGGGTPPPTNSITFTAPTASSKWPVGSTQYITWKTVSRFDSMDIEYYNGSVWVPIVTHTADDGTYTWTVPNTPTTSARIWIKGYSTTTGNLTKYSDYFTIGSSSAINSINITYPNGGETLPAGSQQNIKWVTTGDIKTVDIEYSIDGKTWKSLVTGTENDGSYTWTIPTTMSSNCRLWVKGWGASGNDTDYTDSTFAIGASIIISAPNGGENWSAGTPQTITWSSVGEVGNVKIDYSLNMGGTWTTIVASTANDGSYPWTLPVTQSSLCIVRLAEISGGKASDTSNAAFTIGGPTSITFDKSALNFGAIQGGATTSAQEVNITNGGGGTLNWSAVSNASWLTLSSATGTGNGSTSVGVNINGLGVGQYTGTITVTDSGAENSPQTLNVTLNVLNSGQDMSPFGILATPENGISGVSGSIGITGWALDDLEVASVKIYRDINGELSYIGDAVFVEGARPDVEAAYPEYPFNYRAGWGYMLLTNFLPDGVMTLVAIATDNTGHQAEMGRSTITVDNANAKNPFGAIDSPGQGSIISGSAYRNNGWALTPMPNMIPTNGSTINVYIDGVAIGKATYNLYRSDIAQLFPGYANSSASWGYFDIDTTAYSNGLHTIQWSATDNAGNSEGIGSRYFKIFNSSARSTVQGSTLSAVTDDVAPRLATPDHRTIKKSQVVVASDSVYIKTGYNDLIARREVLPTKQGIINIEMQEAGRIEVVLNLGDTSNQQLTGYMLVNGQSRPLPVGSTLDKDRGVFYWQAGPGFVGQYHIVFVATTKGKTNKKEIRLNILPHTSN